MRARASGILCSILFSAALPFPLHAQSPEESAEPAALPAPQLSNDRILGVIPNFQTVSNPDEPYIPLPVREKWKLFIRETLDPYSFATGALGAGLSQWRDSDPKYGEGVEPYFQRFGAAWADLAAQNLFSDALLASVLHEDPRYFREGPSRPVIHRIGYALSRVVITRRDSGGNCFNFSGIGGMALGITLSNAYYPERSVNADEVESRFVTSLIGAALGNLLPEFWPDVREKLARYKHW